MIKIPLFNPKENLLSRYVLVSLCIFATIFLIYYGREALCAKSWKYVINVGDEHFYWAAAKGASESPASDGNAFYYEDKGKIQPVPYLSANVIGWLAKLFHLPVLFFFPAWHILLPFLLWLSIFLCLTKIWKYPDPPSAILTLMVMMSTLFLRGQPPTILLRFSRPLDALWLSVIWISIAMHPKMSKKFHWSLLTIVIFLTVWFNPFFGFLGTLVTFLEALWQSLIEKNKKRSLSLWAILSIGLIAILSIFGYLKINLQQNPWVINVLNSGAENLQPSMGMSSIFLYLFVITIVLLNKLLAHKNKFDEIDRLLIFLFLVEPISTHTQLFLPNNFQFANHRYYYWIIEMTALAGWLVVNFRNWIHNKIVKKNEVFFLFALIAFQIFIIFNDRLNFFISFGGGLNRSRLIQDNSLLFISTVPSIFFISWIMVRLEEWKQSTLKRYMVTSCILLTLFAWFVFAGLPINPLNENFPFDGAYRWLQKNADRDDVVLTISPTRIADGDYILYYTNQKTYLNPLGEQLSGGKHDPDNRKRFGVYFELLTGDALAFLLEKQISIKEKLSHPRLNYILIDLPSPFYSNAVGMLKNHIKEVYRDNKCLVWKINL